MWRLESRPHCDAGLVNSSGPDRVRRAWPDGSRGGRVSGEVRFSWDGLVFGFTARQGQCSYQVMTSPGGFMKLVVPLCCMCAPAPLGMAGSETSQEQLLGGLPWPGWAKFPGSSTGRAMMTSRRRSGLRL